MINAFTLLLLFQLVGEVLVTWLQLPLPGPVVGMLLLFIALVVRGAAPQGLRDMSNTLLQHMMLLFVPAVSGVLIYAKRVGEEWLPILVATVGGAAITLVVTALTLKLLLERAKKTA
jgi:holin-like protein